MSVIASSPAAIGERRLLVTGATGVVGAEVSSRAAARGWSVTRTARRGDSDVLAWDLAEPPPTALAGPWSAIVHTAARPKWNLSAAEAWRANVETTRSVLRLVGPQTRLVHVSSAFATGHTGSVDSPDLHAYRNTYEWSKAAAERELAGLPVPYAIVRPPLVIGRRADGGVARFSGMYTFLSALTSSQLPALVADQRSPLEVVSTTDVAECCLDLAEPSVRHEVVTLGRGPQALSMGTALDLLEAELTCWRARRGLAPLSWPRLISPDQWDRFFKPMAEKVFTPRQRRILDLLEPFVPYLSLGDGLPVDRPVAPMQDCLARCARHWFDAHPGLASRALRTWRG